MKRIIKKRVISIALCLAMILGMLGNVTSVKAATQETTYVQYSDLTSFRGDTYSAPVKEGYVFAGWYTQNGSSYKRLTEEQANEKATNNEAAFAKFVDEQVLRVKYQVTKNTTTDTSATGVRLLTGVDTLYFDKVGFQVQLNGKTTTLLTNTVYTTVNGHTKDGVTAYTPSETFGTDSAKYFMTCQINQIPNAAFGNQIKITPMWKTMDGTTVQGQARTIVIYNSVDGFDDGLGYGSLWSAPSTVKVSQTGTTSLADTSGGLTYSAVRNEYESQQLFITASSAVTSYELFASDLTTTSGDILLAENVDVYVEKYVTFTDDYGTKTMPDALIPMNAADNHSENTITSGNNAGLWTTIYIPKDTVAGTYTGNFTLVVDGASGKEYIQIPVTLTVKNYTLSDEVTAKSIFSWRYDRVAVGELNGSQEMMECYYEFFEDYRISLQLLPLGTLSGTEYVENVIKYYDDISTYSLMTSVGEMPSYFTSNEAVIAEQILALAANSTAEKNLFDKAMIYFYDEPDFTVESTREAAVTMLTKVNQILANCVTKIEQDTSGNYDSFTAIADWKTSITGIPNVITGNENITEPLLDSSLSYVAELLGLINCICPQYYLADDVQTLCENNDIELWWYGCVGPQGAYPSYHIGSDNLLSSRTVSWMQMKYGIEGNLYWDAASYIDDDNNGEYLNVYVDPLRNTSGTMQSAGDGFLTYPGAAYGVYGPLPSMRLMSIRDGMEEYEILSDIQGAGYSSMNSLYEDMEDGTMKMRVDGATWTTYSGVLNLTQTTHTFTFADKRNTLLDLAAQYCADTEAEFAQNALTVQARAVQGSVAHNFTEKASGTDTSHTSEGAEAIFGFDTYAEITGAGLRVSKLLGETVVNADSQYITNGTGSWMIRPEGDYASSVSNAYPWFTMRCKTADNGTTTTFKTSNFSGYDEIRMDVYNAGDEEVFIQLSFSILNMNGEYTDAEQIFKLSPSAWTTCKFDLTDEVYSSYFNLTDVKEMTVTFLDKKTSRDDKTATVYLDNLRGVTSSTQRVQTTFAASFEDGVDFEDLSDFYLFSETNDYTKMELLRVAYEDTAIANTATLAQGTYGLMGQATGRVWPTCNADLGFTCEAGSYLTFWVYVEADEEKAAGQTYWLNDLTSSAVIVSDRYFAYNQWHQVRVWCSAAESTMKFEFNFDNGNGVSELGSTPVNIYMDKFEFEDNSWGPIQ